MITPCRHGHDTVSKRNMGPRHTSHDVYKSPGQNLGCAPHGTRIHTHTHSHTHTHIPRIGWALLEQKRPVYKKQSNHRALLQVLRIGRRVLQCVEVCCSVVMCVAVCCSVLQCPVIGPAFECSFSAMYHIYGTAHRHTHKHTHTHVHTRTRTRTHAHAHTGCILNM